MQKAVRDWELPFIESREGHQEASKYANCPHTSRVVQTPGLQASIGLEMSVIRELLGEFGDVWGCLEKCLFSSLAHFLIGSLIFVELSCRICLYIFEINSLSVASFAIIFSHSERNVFSPC